MSVAEDSSDEELDWEEVHVPEEQQQLVEIPFDTELTPPASRENIEITLETGLKVVDSKKKAASDLHKQRVLRTTSHKIHTVALLANAWIRNKWINDPLLHARLISLTPLALQNGFAMIHKSRIPDQNKRGRLFEAAVDRLVTWWCDTFFSVTYTGHIRSKTFQEAEAEAALAAESDEKSHERIRSVESLMKHALMQRGSRDTSAQLFTALCRALDIPARLVVSLQSVPWKSTAGKQTPKSGNKVTPNDGQKCPSASHDDSSLRGARILETQHPTSTPPVFWTEVFSRADSRWLPVDPIRGIVNKRHIFDPDRVRAAGSSKGSAAQCNRMLYVICLEEDGFGRDVTARYAHEYTAKVSKAQAIGAGSGGRKEWWASVVQCITRPYRLQRDDLEDEELHNHQLTEGMPTTIVGFKNHPLYALARHLRRDQVIDPLTEVGKFRGEPVYPRSHVISLKTAENWMRQGRVVRQGSQAMKMVRQRVVTINRQREMELSLDRGNVESQTTGNDEIMQGLYAFSQTEVYRPEPIRDGKIPKNDFGNIDVYVPSMLPEGAAHIPFKGAAKIAKKLGFDYAEAVTGFEFRKRRAMPVIQGIVVAAENENVIVDACLEAEQSAEERARAKRLEQACKRWVRLVHGLRIRERLQQQYAYGEVNNSGMGSEQQSKKSSQQESWLDASKNDQGYLTSADDVVEPFHLPRDLHQLSPSTVPVTTSHLFEDDDRARRLTEDKDLLQATRVPGDEILVPAGDDDSGEEMKVDAEVNLVSTPNKGMPKTMRELAESHVRNGTTGTSRPQRDRDDQVAKGSRGRGMQGPTESGEEELERPSTARRRRGTKTGTQTKSSARTARPSKKRTRRCRRDEDTSDVDEAEGSTSSSKRHRLNGSATLPPTPNPNPNQGSGRVLRPRTQKSEARLREERVIEEAYRKAVAE